MGSYGIGVTRVLAALAEANNDERGLAWPAHVAPAHVTVVATGKDPAVFEAAEALAARAVVARHRGHLRRPPGTRLARREVRRRRAARRPAGGRRRPRAGRGRRRGPPAHRRHHRAGPGRPRPPTTSPPSSPPCSRRLERSRPRPRVSRSGLLAPARAGPGTGPGSRPRSRPRRSPRAGRRRAAGGRRPGRRPRRWRRRRRPRTPACARGRPRRRVVEPDRQRVRGPARVLRGAVAARGAGPALAVGAVRGRGGRAAAARWSPESLAAMTSNAEAGLVVGEREGVEVGAGAGAGARAGLGAGRRGVGRRGAVARRPTGPRPAQGARRPARAGR